MKERLAKFNVLVADRDYRTASLVQKILFSFGFRHIDCATSGESAIALLKARPYDLIITEWNMEPVNGLELVKTIRNTRNEAFLRRDIPIVMLTARADKESVGIARDAGITEFLAKPFSAKTISTRIIQIIDNPRSFVESNHFAGPCRRRRGEPPEGVEDRRVPPAQQGDPSTRAIITPANMALKAQLGRHASDIINDMAVAEAQAELLKAEDDFIGWAQADIKRLEEAYEQIVLNPGNMQATRALQDAAYAIKSQAGIFGYPLGTEIATLMVEYLAEHEQSQINTQTVIRKHIDTMSIVFKQKIKDSGQGIAMDLMFSLRKLINKLG